MNRQERERIIASMTDGELEELVDSLSDDQREQLHKRAAAPEDPARQFLRAVMAERERDWFARSRRPALRTVATQDQPR